MTIRVGIADDQALVRDGFRVQLGLVPDLELVGEASNGQQAMALACTERPDVLLMDIRMPVLDAIAATRRIVGDPDTAGVRVLILTTFDVDELVYTAGPRTARRPGLRGGTGPCRPVTPAALAARGLQHAAPTAQRT